MYIFIINDNNNTKLFYIFGVIIMRVKYLALFIAILFIIGSAYVHMNEKMFTEQKSDVLSRYGSRGNEVVQIQTRLKNWGYYKGNIDGIYGSKTTEAVRHFQRKNGLKVDGIAGAQTLYAIGLPTGTSSVSKDVNLLGRIITGEARGEPYVGMVAIGGVVMNRIRDSRFPNTIAGVIYQPGAFTAVADGQINLPMDPQCLRAAQDAINGWDPSHGGIYYYNPSTATNQWIQSRPIVTRIGKHVFCK